MRVREGEIGETGNRNGSKTIGGTGREEGKLEREHF